MNTIEAVRHFELGNPLVGVISALDSHLSYFDDFTKFNLNPLICIICFRRPGTGLTTTAGFVESGVGRSMVTVPLQSISQSFNQSINQSITQLVNYHLTRICIRNKQHTEYRNQHNDLKVFLPIPLFLVELVKFTEKENK